MKSSDMKSTFNRDYKEDLNLKKTQDEFIKEFMSDVEKGKAFLAFRPMKKITLYYLGRQMCVLEPSNCYKPSIESGYLPILKSDKNSNGFVTEEEWREKTGVTGYTWKDVYQEIKDNLSILSEPEAIQVSGLYKYSPLASYRELGAVLLDIEAKFSYPKVNGVSRDDLRIDVVLYNSLTRQLAFIEVKRFADNRLQKNGELQIDIIEQLKAYQILIRNEQNEIVREYNKTIRALSDNYGISIAPIDEKKDILLGLLITEYSSGEVEKVKKISKEIESLSDLNDVAVLSVGNVSNVKSETLEKKWFQSMSKGAN